MYFLKDLRQELLYFCLDQEVKAFFFKPDWKHYVILQMCSYWEGKFVNFVLL